MKKNLILLTAAAASAAFVANCSATTVVVDNFDEYTAGTAIATSAVSFPWRRFGYAVEDQLYATTASSLDGTAGGLGAQIPIGIGPNAGTTADASATVEYHYATPTDLSGYGSASVLSESLDAAEGNVATSTAAIQLVITDGNTTYSSYTPVPETAAALEYTFPIDNADLFDADDESTPETLAQVLAGATEIGFRISSPTGDSVETIAFDDFDLTTVPTATPEPASAGLICLGLGAFAARRRRTV